MKVFSQYIKQVYIRLLVIIPMLWGICRTSSQNLSVESFRLLETDLTANTQGTMERDQNGDVAALIKIVTSETGFAFDGGMMGIVKTTQKTGEIWVYVPHGIQKMTISHQQLGVLRDYFFPLPIEKARTYELILKAGIVRTIVEQTVTSQYVVFKVQPSNAIVFIDDDEPRSLDSDGMLSIRLKRGHHTYRVTAASFLSESGAIEVQSEKVTKEIVLQSTRATLTVNTASDAEIWINDVQKGTGYWTGELESGVYLVESRKPSHISVKEEITLEQQERRTITLGDPIPIYGVLDVQSSPIECDVYIDDNYVGQTPLLIEKFLAGEHIIRIQKRGYDIIEQTIKVDEVSQSSHNYTLHPVGDLTYEPDIKPEKTTEAKKTTIQETGVNPEYVDLGLSVRWATFNMGATKPEEYGGYYAWGETEHKSVYTWQTYKWCKGSSNEITKYCTNSIYGFNKYKDNRRQLELIDDVATVKWGANWRIPTAKEWRELLTKCNWQLTYVGGVTGYMVTSKKNGRSIFLPLAGIREGGKVNNVGLAGMYRSSNLDMSDPSVAQNASLSPETGRLIGYDYRFGGLSVRPVYP